MADSILDATTLRGLFSYDPDTGEFTRLKPCRGPSLPDGRVGSNDLYGYKTTRIKWKSYKLHRLAWLYMTGEWPAGDVDHINGRRSDNRFANLRDVPRKTNLENQRRGNGETGLLGAYYDKRKGSYYARISQNDKSIHLGTFATAEAAHRAYLEAKRAMHSGCTI